ncbi:MAG TPA: M56 family metallopeptidase [Thermoanaerobaculia bacterium]|nr:M56 family metallopeptidase [Thermoanaerobaculia bacterium]
MHEQLARVSHSIEIHLLYASIVWLAAWLLTSMQRGTATAKYWIWVATSLNFILPLSLIPDRFWPSQLSWFTPRSIILAAGNGIPLSAPAIAVLWVVWSLGAVLMLTRLSSRINGARRETRATPEASFFMHGVPVRFAANRKCPAVDGVLRPQIALPDGIDRLLTERELNAVLIHELRHAKRRDNLIRLIHEASLCALWFHPLVWITGSRLALYRELSCDESVSRRARGEDLVSALAKLAEPEDASLLQATASSFISHRLARLAGDQTRRTDVAANTMLAVAFGAVLFAAALGPAAQSAASYACAHTHADHR